MPAAPVDGLTVREARASDLPAIVGLLADDRLGSGREQAGDPLPDAYHRAFAAIASDPLNHLLVADRAAAVVGCLQLTVIPGLSRMGAWRGQIEGVRVAASARGTGIGTVLIAQAIDRARAHGCTLVQLTSDKTRPEAIRFYEALGFIGSHEGMKLAL